MPAQASARDSCRSSRAPVEGLQPPQMNLLRQSSKARTSRHQPTKYDVKGGSLGRPAFLLRVNRMKVFSKLKEELAAFWAIQIVLFALIAVLRIFFGPMPTPQV